MGSLDGVQIPFASASTLWRMKQTARAQDIPDRIFLRQLLQDQGIQIEPVPAEDPLTRGWRRFRAWWKKTDEQEQ